MFSKRTTLSLAGLSLLLICSLAGSGLPAGPGGLTGWTIIRTPDGFRLDVPLDWPVRVHPTGTTFANSDEALDSLDTGLAPQTFRALIVSGGLDELPLPEGIERSKVAAALAVDEHRRGVSLRGATGDGQTILIVKAVAPDRYGGVFVSAAPGVAFPHQLELEEIVGKLKYQAADTESSSSTLRYWLGHVQDIRRFDRTPRLWYDLMVPEGEAPSSGWPVLVLAHANTSEYASIAQSRLAMIVTPHFTWNTFEEDRQILDAILAEVLASYPADDRRVIMHGCSVGGRFVFQYTVAEPNRIMAAVPMAAFDLELPSSQIWHTPFVFFYGDHDPLYANARAAIQAMQSNMDSVDLYLDAGQGHVCDPALGLEALQGLLVK